MNVVKLALIAAFAFTASVSVGSIVTSSSAEAAAKPAPGKCGVGMYYVTKTKKCAAK
jgi:predicted transporter